MDQAGFYVLMDEVLDLDEGTIKGDEVLEDLEWESITIVSFIALVDEEYELVVSAEAVLECKSIEDLYNLVVKTGQES